jgi:myo-inositol-1(or 4)-monophosphatase
VNEAAELDLALLKAARAAAAGAAEVHRKYAGRLGPSEWGEKGTSDFVTEVDLEAERLIVGALRERFPDHAFLAEEGTVGDGSAPGDPDPASIGARDQPVLWIIDPLDGTTNWLHGYPEYAVSIAAVDADGLRVGIVLNSATGEEYEAVRGGGSRRNGQEIRTSDLREIRLALLGTGFPFKRAELIQPYLKTLGRALLGTSGVRRAGAAALDLCALACGRTDGFWETWLMPWDVAAGALIVREAGGIFTSLRVDEPTGELSPLATVARAGEDGVALFEGRAAWQAGSRIPGLAGSAYMASNAHLLDDLSGVLNNPTPGRRSAAEPSTRG